jgi:hypothetical protein
MKASKAKKSVADYKKLLQYRILLQPHRRHSLQSGGRASEIPT